MAQRRKPRRHLLSRGLTGHVAHPIRSIRRRRRSSYSSRPFTYAPYGVAVGVAVGTGVTVGVGVMMGPEDEPLPSLGSFL